MKFRLQDVVVDKRAIEAVVSRLTAEWLWLVPMIPTACGDLFLRCADGSVSLLDTYAGTCQNVASDKEQLKALLNDDEQACEWFKLELFRDLVKAGLKREPGQCFSPYVPPIVGGRWEASNFHACDLLVHLSVLGQIHRQVKDLPPGTKISGFDVAWD